MNKVYHLSHVRDEGDKDEDEQYWILHTRELAYMAQLKLSDKPGFIDHPDGSG
ncbi:TPA_asm: hypothetical protein GND82_004596 [Salmonella enterica subsp. salamae serovar 60:g,m,t:z6]|uniref:Uncharacterized protein n=2 Tax=Salmonella enterica TaxID=28901 RepID=A0A8E6IEW4_SALER|nr:hypothetical protein [Salmonella enterica]EGZ3996700.1 hypothetical protein [Salmonella enterica subsp. enterica serovar Wichita]QVP49374.1 hypothetical protein AIT66_18950 [Salmonella enterica subsp. salamae]HAE2269892.1 hypothetical protein [Salmonella enterica subsp. enterica serovar 1,9,12:-:-]HAE4191515.1 hypothetical protein [Salmonella enterica subsp. houtenae serovar 1,40:z4,z32:-]HAE7515645.1 hypothetical protein [Salmonella enterica subsp. salamae serovar 60:g,m,t:z6]HCM1945924.1